ncbi:hypothetical protein L1987_84116 [Smallanthus sonchifolius]|uniref:Uncharacterized protein n=1 Tax=Smallanthus sonchifolius TaxID=185202 RepID=A0ACB8YES5_9ASTR|nr:hypothetical protein L1987_84116 [Smallanthus sonchifolius]
MQKLVFDQDMFQVSGDELYNNVNVVNERRTMTKRCGIFSAIYQVLLKHSDPIIEFSFKIQTNESCVEVDHIVSYLSSKNSVKKFTLDTVGGHYRLPSYLFALDELTELHVISCNLNRQHKFSRFINLSTLFVKDIKTSKSSLAHLVLGFPSLKRLTLERRIPKVLPNPLLHLKEVCLVELRFLDERELLFLACRFEWVLEEAPSPEDDAWSCKVEDYEDLWLSHLSVLDFFNMTNGKLYLDVVKLILATSPVLKMDRLFLLMEVEEEELDIYLQELCLHPNMNRLR